MTESQIMAQLASTVGKDNPAFKAMQENKDRRNERRRENYQEASENAEEFMDFIRSI